MIFLIKKFLFLVPFFISSFLVIFFTKDVLPEISFFEGLKNKIFITYSFYFWSIILINVVFLKILLNIKKEKHIRGSKLLTENQFSQLIKKKFKNRTDNFKNFDKSKKIEIPQEFQSTHFFAIGSTGTGKTSLINHYLSHIRGNNEKAIIVDINGEYYKKFGKKNDVILSATDSRSPKWDFSCEEMIPSEVVSEFLIPSTGSNNAFWWKSARIVLAELLEEKKTALEIAKALSTENGFRDSISPFALNVLGKNGSTQEAGVLGSIVSDLTFLFFLADHNEKNFTQQEFSVSKWASDETDKRWLFLPILDTDIAVFSPLLRVWVNSVFFSLLQSTTEKEKIKINIILDEIASISKLELLPKGLERLRKYGGKIFLGAQSVSQIMEIYGEKQTRNILSNLGNKFIFRPSENWEAKELSDFLGDSEIMALSEGTQKGDKISKSENLSKKITKLILPSELKTLKTGEFYLSVPEMNPVKSTVILGNFPEKNPSIKQFYRKKKKKIDPINDNMETGETEEKDPFLDDLQEEVLSILQ